MNPPVSGNEAVKAINDVFGGPYPGCRVAHARGVVCRGEFRPNADARQLTTAAFMQADTVPVTVRFSNASGDPARPDRANTGRGMATRFLAGGDAVTDIVAVTLPCFFVRTPEDFVALNQALARWGRWPADPRRAIPFVASHRESWRAIWAVLSMKPVPSYANCCYNALHTFAWTDRNDMQRHVRYSWRPEAGEATLGRAAARRLPWDYLSHDLMERLGRTPAHPIRFALELQIAPEDARVSGSPENPLNDPTRVWRRDRTQIVPAGVLELTSLADLTEELRFYPVPRVTGIGPSQDRILRFRPYAYEVSAAARKVQDHA
jgi:catalase